ncbi:type I glutamate--ammonia ligase [Sulfoacidibacillus thermotolerans]|uniref:Glutamine synthetase n=1 Tax=Sulfoacidibacillus thermotolerans TaxID=1765684 RepID=A0A2U3DCD6_SULT2|nr:type I glutamate--ammonia ligase [Sulfoacidibacillus thermotolerans]PWI58936.1 type I glutamate--ammonia ligase [Sulfoacidibacillus thermotolerans]
MTASEILSLIQEKNIQMVDFRIVDLPGRQHHVTIPAAEVDEDMLTHGVAFDGSSIQGFRGIEESDMVMRPDLSTAYVDAFTAVPTLDLICDVYEPSGNRYNRDPRYIAQKAEAFLQKSGVGTAAYFGPELEFFVFDDVRFASSPSGAFYEVDSEEANWNTGKDTSPNLGYKVKNKGGYFPVQPTDSQHDLRTEMVLELMNAGIRVERHHHEVASAGQAEINFRFDTLTNVADTVLLYKYIVRNVARRYGKVATFMPKPIFGDNGSGMHVHQSIFDGDKPLFYEEGKYANLSKMALHYIGGILYHAPAILAFATPSTNSFKRLVPGFEAPVNLVFSKGNRSAAVRVPVAAVTPKSARIEFRTPDGTANPYLAFSAMLLAGLDGIRREIDPTAHGFGPVDKNIYELPSGEKEKIRSVPGSLDEVLAALEADHEFLLEGGVFDRDFINTWIEFKRSTEVQPLALRPHPHEFQMYFDL